MGKLKYFAGNMALFTISNFVSKILVFLLVPFYTNVLSTADYGIADVMQTTLLLLVPALTVNMGEAALRYGIDRADKRREILKYGVKYNLRACLFVLILCVAASLFIRPYRGYLLVFSLLFFANCFYEYLILFFQGLEKVKIVVCGSVFSTVILIASNLFWLLVVKAGLYGYLFSQIASFSMASVLMLLLARKHASYIYEKTEGDDAFEKELLDYGKPLIAYSTGAWINNASDRYLVSLLCGVSVNGIYGVAYKIPSILTVFQRIFAQSFQMSATKSYNDGDKNEFFSMMFKSYNAFMVTGCSFLILIVRFLASFMFKKDFYAAWVYVPPLVISVVFGALTGFFGSICLANKDSKAMGKATFTGALINVVLNLILIPKLSAMGAAIATAVSYYVMFMMAYQVVKKYADIEHNGIKEHVTYLILVIQAYIMINDTGYVYPICILMFAAILILYAADIMEIAKKLWLKFKQSGVKRQES
ncbi:MAG: polysaccharide biosynthesis C-terminal domain-containing protein [Lachnospiraceae bacterium]|nr:polysaccharide biosynthesis C-terminal domain-containing protein [Lachnospiraceae bacterium]